MEIKKRLGELLVQQKIVNQEVMDDALRVQLGGNRRLGQILLQMEVLSEDQLANILSQQLDTPLIDIEEVFSAEVKQILPRYLCTKYGVLPLTLKNNNIMLTAMSDPSDNEAITDVERYTGKVIEPCLARQSDISNGITQNIPYSLKDIFNPRINTRLTSAVAAAALVLVIIFGVTTYNYIQTARHGTVSQLANSILYEHHDLMVGFETSGKFSLHGHSAFSDGYYSVTFDDTNTLKAFIDSRKDDFSSKQLKWLKWVLNHEKSSSSSHSTIINN